MIRITAIVLFIAAIALHSEANNSVDKELRSAFVHAAQQVNARTAFLDWIKETDIKDEGLKKAYHGAALAMSAECSNIPWTKYTLFRDGTQMLEEAISENPSNVEYRYLRFLIQIKSPDFLDYQDNVKADYYKIAHYVSTSHSNEAWENYFKSFAAAHPDLLKSFNLKPLGNA